MARHRSATALTHAAPVDPVMVGRARDLLERAHVLFDNADGVDDDVERFRQLYLCLLYTSPSPRDQRGSRMPSSA